MNFTLDEVTVAIAQWASANSRVQRVWLFGSRVRGKTKLGGDVRNDSDLDVAIDAIFHGDDKDERLADLMDLDPQWKEELSRLAPWSISLVYYNESEIIRKYVDECSIIIYDNAAHSQEIV